MDEVNRLVLNQFMARHLPIPKTTQNSFSEPGGRNWHLKTYSSSTGGE
jgi:hypothetical protein